MLNNLKLHKRIWFITFGFALVAAISGITHLEIYNNIVAKELLPGALSQDVISCIVAIVALVLLPLTKEKQIKMQIIILGLLGYLFYAYGIYVIERAYNMFYLLYMAIFALSFWAIGFSLANIKSEVLQKVKIGKKIRYISSAGALLQPLIFYPLWIGMLIPLMQTGNQIDSLYSIFIIDLAFIMPAFAILAYFTMRNKGMGLLLLPAIYLLGFTLIFSLALGELLKPFFAASIKIDSFWQSFGLSIFFLLLGIMHLRKLHLKR